MKYIFLLVAVVFCFSSCGEPEMAGLTAEEYIAANNLNAQELDKGVFIVLHAIGNERRPNINSRIRVSYEGRLTNDKVFDSSSDSTFDMYKLIEGWRIGLKEIGEGGSCTLIVPPGAAYGTTSVPGIPANSTLVFDMNLMSVQ